MNCDAYVGYSGTDRGRRSWKELLGAMPDVGTASDFRRARARGRRVDL